MKKTNFVLYVDDTGFNTHDKTSTILQHEKATHVGVIIREDLLLDLEYIMDGLCEQLKKKYNTDEFHFTNIFNRKPPFENININETLEILEIFTEIFNKYSLRISTNTVNSLFKNHINNNKSSLDKSLKAISLPINDKSYSLLFTYTQAKQHIEKLTKKANITKIICDEGLKAPETVLTIPGSQTTIEFKDSSTDKLLQLADFAAWFLSRSKNTLDKIQKRQEVSEIDESLLNIFENLSPLYLNTQANIDTSKHFDYDEIYNETISTKK